MDLQPSDIIFIAIVLWIAIVIDSDRGGGFRKRVPAH
jgi:hypothetical protein